MLFENHFSLVCYRELDQNVKKLDSSESEDKHVEEVKEDIEAKFVSGMVIMFACVRNFFGHVKIITSY